MSRTTFADEMSRVGAEQMSRVTSIDEMSRNEQLSCTQPLSQPMELPSYEEATKHPAASDRKGARFCRQVFWQKGFISPCY